jgi:type II secretory pathway pseudopilin PulG
MGIHQRSGTTATPSRWVILAVVLVAAWVAPERDAVAGASDHRVRFINRCSEQIWLASFGPTSAAPPNDAWALAPTCRAANAAGLCATGQSCHRGSCTCTTDADCAFGSSADTTATCDTAVTPHVCVRKTSVLVSPGWNGRFWARTRCEGTDAAFSCQTGQCGEPSGNIDCTTQQATANRATLF